MTGSEKNTGQIKILHTTPDVCICV